MTLKIKFAGIFIIIFVISTSTYVGKVKLTEGKYFSEVYPWYVIYLTFFFWINVINVLETWWKSNLGNKIKKGKVNNMDCKAKYIYIKSSNWIFSIRKMLILKSNYSIVTRQIQILCLQLVRNLCMAPNRILTKVFDIDAMEIKILRLLRYKI